MIFELMFLPTLAMLLALLVGVYVLMKIRPQKGY